MHSFSLTTLDMVGMASGPVRFALGAATAARLEGVSLTVVPVLGYDSINEEPRNGPLTGGPLTGSLLGTYTELLAYPFGTSLTVESARDEPRLATYARQVLVRGLILFTPEALLLCLGDRLLRGTG